MNIHVIGPGVVGRATGEGFARFGHNVVYTDKGSNGFHHLVHADVRFICTPEEVAPEIVRGLKTPGLVVIRSSVSPGTTVKLAQELNMELVHNPEFLREAVAEFEFMGSNFAILGLVKSSEPRWGIVAGLYKNMGKRVILCDATESELVKITLNCYLATQISFWNQVKLVADRLGINSHRIARLALNDRRVSRYGAVMHGRKYGLRCLPKDVQQMLSLGGRMPLIQAVMEINEEVPV